MRIKRLFLLAFLTFLYIAPLVFISSYGPSAIPAQQNMNKDFIPSIEYYETIELADYGEDQDENYDPNYVKTQVLDNDAFEEVGIDIEIWFEIDVVISGFSYASYLYATSQDDCNIGFYNFDTTSFDNFGEPLPTSYDWMNGSVYGADYWNTTHIGCQLSEVGIGDANFFWDYSELTLMKPTEWYDESWLYRKSISVTGSAGAGSDYQVNLTVPYAPHMQSDFDDLRFTDYDGVTEWDYWIETYTASTTATVWVEWGDDLGSNSMGWMYYGNSAVSTTSDGEDTFLFYEDWTVEEMNAARWDLIANNGAVSWDDTDANHGSILKLEGGVGALTQSYECVYDDIAPSSVMFRANIEQTLAANQRIRIGSGSPYIFSFAYIDCNGATLQLTVYDDDANPDHQALDAGLFGAYHTFEITRDGTNARLYVDTVLEETASCDPDIVSTPATFIGVEDEEKDLYVDWFAVRKFIAGTEPEFDSFGAEEALYPPDWQEVGEATFYFSVPFDYWALNMGLVFGGLILMLLSVCITAVKVRDRTITKDAGILLLFLFCVGWGLFIGGTLIG